MRVRILYFLKKKGLLCVFFFLNILFVYGFILIVIEIWGVERKVLEIKKYKNFYIKIMIGSCYRN